MSYTLDQVETYINDEFNNRGLNIQQYDDVEQRIYFSIRNAKEVQEMQARLAEDEYGQHTIVVQALIGEDWYDHNTIQLNDEI